MWKRNALTQLTLRHLKLSIYLASIDKRRRLVSCRRMTRVFHVAVVVWFVFVDRSMHRLCSRENFNMCVICSHATTACGAACVTHTTTRTHAAFVDDRIASLTTQCSVSTYSRPRMIKVVWRAALSGCICLSFSFAHLLEPPQGRSNAGEAKSPT